MLKPIVERNRIAIYQLSLTYQSQQSNLPRHSNTVKHMITHMIFDYINLQQTHDYINLQQWPPLKRDLKYMIPS